MGNSIDQWRCAIGCHNNFVQSKEMCNIMFIINCIQSLLAYFGPCIIPFLMNISYCHTVLVLLVLRCGDVSPNPGPVKFCHLNARSLLAGVDLNKHIDDQYSLLDEIHETLIHIGDFDIIAISETWLKDNINEDVLKLEGYQIPFFKNRQSRGGGSHALC